MSDLRGNYRPGGARGSAGANRGSGGGRYQGPGDNSYDDNENQTPNGGIGSASTERRASFNQNMRSRMNNQRYDGYQRSGSGGMGGSSGSPGSMGPDDGAGGGGFQMPPMVQVPWDQYELRKKKELNPVWQTLLAIGSVITFARNLCFNIIFLLLLFVFFGGYMAIQNLKENGISLSSDALAQLESQALKAEVLYFDLEGGISEAPFSSGQLSSLQRELEFALYGQQAHELVAIEKALTLAANDTSIKKIVLSVDGMAPISLSVADRIGQAMEQARHTKSDDPAFSREVVVVGMNYSQASYALATHADRIVLDPLGEVGMRGIALTSLYFKDALDKAHITPYIFRAGHFKSAVEPFMLNAMSADVRKEYQAIAFKSWNIYENDLKKSRAIKSGTVLPEAATYVEWLRQFNGNRAQMQQAQGLVDEVTPLNSYFEQLSSQVNADADYPHRPAIITYQDYLLRYQARTTGGKAVGALSEIEVPRAASLAASALGAVSTGGAVGAAISGTARSGAADVAHSAGGSVSVAAANNAGPTAQGADPAALGAPAQSTQGTAGPAGNDADPQLARRVRGTKALASGKVAVIYGIGEIRDYGEKVTDFTPDNIIPQLEKAQTDDSIQAIVLYLNSPGGSVTASEKIRRAVADVQRNSSKPVIISMNGTAASGAYWIGSQGEHIFATPSTITGSIGVFGLSFGAHQLLNRYGAYQDGVATNELALAPIAKEMPQSQQAMIYLSVENTYRQFIELVARNRHLKANDYEIFAEGQIFLADDARSVGLVDEVGTLDDAINYAAHAAGISPTGVNVVHFAPDSASSLGGFESLLFGAAQAWLPEELTYSLLELRSKLKLAAQNDEVSLMAISPLGAPKL